MWQRSASAARYQIAVDLTDLDLRDALAEALASHPAMELADLADSADLVITDRPGTKAGGGPVLHLGVGPLPRDAPVELVLSAAHLTAAGLRLAPPAAPTVRDPSPRLSPREREVLALLLDGAPNKAIARALGISVSTAKFHVAALLAKLGARNRSEAVALALRDGLAVL